MLYFVYINYDIFNVIDTISRSTNVNPSTVSQDRTRPLCLQNCAGSRLEFENATTSANSTTSYPSYRTRPISTNSGHCKEHCTGSHLENEVTVSSKNTPSKPIRKSLRRNMVRNINVYNKHVKTHMKEYNYMKALRASRLRIFV